METNELMNDLLAEYQEIQADEALLQKGCMVCDQTITYFEGELSSPLCLRCETEADTYLASPELSEFELEDWACQYDNDPNPYHGTY